MSRKERPHPYVEKVRDDLHRYAQGLLTENERLRLLVAAFEAQQQRLHHRSERLEEALRQAEDLKTTVAILERDKARLHDELTRAREEAEGRARERERLSHELARVETEGRRSVEQFADLERRNAGLASLYVASYRLHGTLDRGEVLECIQDILANLVGSEQTAVFELSAGDDALELLSASGIDAERYLRIPVGQGPIGAVAASGSLFTAGPGGCCERSPEEPDLTACIPLALGERVSGVVAVFRLLPQKRGLEDLDRELFELLATHAATALYCTSSRSPAKS